MGSGPGRASRSGMRDLKFRQAVFRQGGATMRQFAWAVAAAMVIGGLVTAQQTTPPPAFRSGVDLVRFDLSVTDDKGTPLPDVRPDEIEIRENGTPLPIVLFQRVQEPAGFYSDAALRAVS